MKIKVFSFRKPYFSHWYIADRPLEPVVNTWLAEHPRATIHTIKHDLTQGIWYPPQLLISIYYTE